MRWGKDYLAYIILFSVFLDVDVAEVRCGNEKKHIYKTLLCNTCSFDCLYCPNRTSMNKEKVVNKVEDRFFHLLREGKVSGAFLSSTIYKDTETSMEKIIEAGKSIRKKFAGYIHLKILPGAAFTHIIECSKYADRLSINLEAPENHLPEIANEKDFRIDLLRRLRWVSKVKERLRYGFTTQFIVGAADENDREIMKTAEKVIRMGAKRVYFSGFFPINGTPLENRKKESEKRILRLYQAEFLIRKYGFAEKELVYDEDGRLPLNRDPKYIFAKENEDLFPVSIADADYRELIKVPGIGIKSAKRIVERRERKKIESMEELTKLGVNIRKAKEFIYLS